MDSWCKGHAYHIVILIATWRGKWTCSTIVTFLGGRKSPRHLPVILTVLGTRTYHSDVVATPEGCDVARTMCQTHIHAEKRAECPECRVTISSSTCLTSLQDEDTSQRSSIIFVPLIPNPSYPWRFPITEMLRIESEKNKQKTFVFCRLTKVLFINAAMLLVLTYVANLYRGVCRQVTVHFHVPTRVKRSSREQVPSSPPWPPPRQCIILPNNVRKRTSGVFAEYPFSFFIILFLHT